MTLTTLPRLAVRTATVADLDQVVAVRREAATRAYRALGVDALETWLAARCRPGYVDALLREPSGLLLVAVDSTANHAVVGSAFVRREPDGTAYLGELYCRDAGRGVGSALLAARLGIARSWNAPLAWCRVMHVNAAALRFLQRWGFTIAGIEPSALIPGALLLRHERALGSGATTSDPAWGSSSG